MAVHYYDEDDIKAGDLKDMNVIVNHQVELTEEEKDEARAKAKERLVDEEYRKITEAVKSLRTIDPEMWE